jgi:hypothetical protein
MHQLVRVLRCGPDRRRRDQLGLGKFLVPFHKLINRKCLMDDSVAFHVMNRLIEVTVDLHHERGDRESLHAERKRLLLLAKELKLIPKPEDAPKYS